MMIIYLGDVPYDINETRIYLNSPVQRSDFSGYMEHPASGRVFTFDNLLSMLSLHETLFDSFESNKQASLLRKGSSLAGTEYRHSEEPQVHERGEIHLPEHPTFGIQILYRQNASWQGLVRCIKTNTVQRFRSALELLFIMESELNTISVLD